MINTISREGGQNAIGDDRITAGANNTKEQRLTAPDRGGFLVSTAFAGGSREYKTREGNTCWPTVLGFVNHPAPPQPAGAKTSTYTALTKRREQEGAYAVYNLISGIRDLTRSSGGDR